VCELLLLNGADINLMDAQQCSPVDRAMLAGHMAVLEVLEAKM
jgi:hypothetical protein